MTKSTRGNSVIKTSSAIIKGLSEDGGLYVFHHKNNDFYNESLLELSYSNLTKKILLHYIEDFEDQDVRKVIYNSYNKQNFTPEVVTIKSFKHESYLNLFNGSTFSFKDLALSMLPNLLKVSKIKNNITKKTIILTATSGDTGSATLKGFSALEDIITIVLYPTDGVSDFQEKQMHSLKNERNIILPVVGDFDDCQRIVKQTLNGEQPSNVSLSSANSINIGRIIPQTIYYFYSYFELVRTNKIELSEKLNIVVPTGNFGNIYAAFVAKQMGLPLNKLIIASNQNNVLTKLFKTGIYDSTDTLHKTVSPSMDILVSSNLERYLYTLYDNDHKFIKIKMEEHKKKGFVEFEKVLTQKDFEAYYASEEETKQAIQNTFKEEGYLIDPHTAVAKVVKDKYQKETNDGIFILIVSTANPYKFSDAIIDALELQKGGSLEEKCNRIESYTSYSIDDRIKEVLHYKVNKKEYTTEEVTKELKRIIGDINDKN